MCKKIFALLILSTIVFTADAFAIPFANGEIRNGAFTDQFEYTIEIHLKSEAGNPLIPPATDFNLGAATLTVDFNNLALGNPVLSEQNATFHNNPGLYDAMSIIDTTPGEVGLVINPSAGSAGALLPSAGVLLAKITFAVLDPARWSNISANATVGPPKNFVNDIIGAGAGLSWSGMDDRLMACAPDIDGIPPASVEVGDTYNFIPTEVDVCSPFNYTENGLLPSWASLDPVTGAITGTPTSLDFGAFNGIEITATDVVSSDSIGPFNIEVTCSTTPTISGAPVTSITAGGAYSFTPSVSGACGAVTFSISTTPTWATFDQDTGVLTGNPTLAHVGTTTGIVISVEDQNLNTSALAAFDLEVTADCVAPIISGSPDLTVASGSAYSFSPTVSNGCGTLEFSIQGRPDWATFSTITGELSGTPGDGHVATYTGIQITVADMFNDTSNLASFDLEVTSSSQGTPANSGNTGGGGGGGGGGCFISSLLGG